MGKVVFNTSESFWQFKEESFKLPASTDYIDLSLDYETKEARLTLTESS